MKKTAFLTVWAMFFLTLSGHSEGSGQLMADLNSDGEPETVHWILFADTEDEGTFYRLQVRDSANGVVWEGPDFRDSAHPMIFGEWHYGVSLPQVLADVDRDGKIELLAPEPQSDVSPTFFRVLEWRQGRFYQSRSASLLETPPGSGTFLWSEGEEYLGTWISEFHVQNRDETFEVTVFSYGGGESADVSTRTVSIIENGFQLKERTAMPEHDPGDDLKGWVEQQRWYLKLAESMPEGVRLMVETEMDEDGRGLIDIREIHEPGSGFDPNVAPMIGQFLASPDRRDTQYFDPVSGDWTSMEDFFQSRNLNLLAE